MKTDNENEPNPRGHRGRKPGDGILKELGSDSTYLKKWFYYSDGRACGDQIIGLVKTWRDLSALITLQFQRKHALGEKRLAKAKSVEIPMGDNIPVGADKEAIEYWQLERVYKPWLGWETKNLLKQVMTAIREGNAQWFEHMARAVKMFKAKPSGPAYPLHSAILELAIVPYTKHKGGTEVYRTDLPLLPIPIYTISEVCNLLERQGLRDSEMGDTDWQRTVRRACKEVGLPLKPGQLGRPRSPRT